ncbi:MAG: metallophosphatase [Tardiphaga sp.]|jgi:3',5'-cyclic AMP phosphodiesterase CpdA|nr:metallophosphatase [Tardiphaga sp.]MDB5628442.1 metallophosphatase [Tardiphaga sp.]
MSFVLAHLSDPHVPPLPVARLRDLAGKRLLGYLNWTRNRVSIHRRDLLDALVADLQAQHPDHIAVTGDVVNLGLDAEFAPSLQWLRGVGAPGDVTLIPGNHDAYVRGALERFCKTFDPYLRGDDDASGFPFLRRRGPVALVAVSSGVPTPPLMATGWLGGPQRDALDAMLAQLADEPVFRVLLIHHPLRSAQSHKRLTDAPQLLEILKHRGVELVLHGHDHVHATIHVDGPRGPIPVIGVPSASSIAHGHRPAAAYNLFAIDGGHGAWRCMQTVRGFGDGAAVSELERVRLV